MHASSTGRPMLAGQRKKRQMHATSTGRLMLAGWRKRKHRCMQHLLGDQCLLDVENHQLEVLMGILNLNSEVLDRRHHCCSSGETYLEKLSSCGSRGDITDIYMWPITRLKVLYVTFFIK